MSHFHKLGVQEMSGRRLPEAVDERFVLAGLLRARRKTIEATYELKGMIREGMTEEDGRRLALDVFRDFGVERHWHRPYVRFGKGTLLTFHDSLQEGYQLQQNDPFYLDVGPVWKDEETGLEYEGDFGDSFVRGTNPEASRCAAVARDLFDEAKLFWNESKTTGDEIYRFLRERARARGYVLDESVEGHRAGDFPHHRFSKDTLASVSYSPGPGLWVLEVKINDLKGRFGAFFEDVLF